MADDGVDVKIGNIEYSENTKVTVSVKVLLIIASSLFTILITLFTMFYFDMLSKNEITNKKLDTVIEDINRDVDNKQSEIKEDIWEIKGDIKVILDRTSDSREESYSIEDNITPPENH